MKSMLIAAGAALLVVSAVAAAAPFAQPQSSSVVATQLTYSSVKYTVGAHNRLSFPVPVTNRPIHMMVASTVAGDGGVGEVTLMRATGDGQNQFQWVGAGFISDGTAAHVEFGASASVGTHIVFADVGTAIDVRVNSAQSIFISNDLAKPATVIVTMMY